MRFKIALRSIIRHRLRSLLSIGMIAGAVSAVVLFHGSTDFFLEKFRNTAAEIQYGNMQVAKEKYWNPGKENRKERLFSLDDLTLLKREHPEVIRASGRLSFFGLVNNDDISVGGKVIGIDTINEPDFSKSVRVMSGQFFTGKNSKEAMVGQLLAKQLNVKAGDTITVLTNTVDGIMNAMDLTVTGIFSASFDEIDSQVIYTPLALTQMILDTTKVDLAVLKFSKLEQSEEQVLTINNQLKTFPSQLKARTWRDLSLIFRQVDKFYKVQNRMIETILLALMFLGILNSVSMSVVERTGEIGTLRSFGEKKSDIIFQFLLESFLLALIGIGIGAVASRCVIEMVAQANIVTDLPSASVPIKLNINFLLSSVIYSSSLALITSVIATFIPAYRAARMNIVEALRKNI
jgi:putative ABC transport system permease protein